ncbi:VOC family protein [Chloroflexota bacterium]
MLTNAAVHPTIPVLGLDRARKFYEEKLGLKVSRTNPLPDPGVTYKVEKDTSLYIYQPVAIVAKAGHILATFEVNDVEEEVEELKAKGVAFEKYDLPGIKTINNIVIVGEMKGAFSRILWVILWE